MAFVKKEDKPGVHHRPFWLYKSAKEVKPPVAINQFYCRSCWHVNSSPGLPSSLTISSVPFICLLTQITTLHLQRAGKPLRAETVSYCVCTERSMILTRAAGARRLNFIHQILLKGRSIFEGTNRLQSSLGKRRLGRGRCWGFVCGFFPHKNCWVSTVLYRCCFYPGTPAL